MTSESSIQTVLGERKLAELRGPHSIVLVHEHLSCDLSQGFGPEYVLQDLPLVTSEVEIASAKNVSLIIDVGNTGHGGDPEFLRDVARKSGVAVVASTGHYREGFFPPEVASRSIAELAEAMVADIEQGLAGTDIKAGAIAEIGFTGAEATELEEKVFLAAARAQAETGAPLLTHTAQGVGWAQQLDLLRRGGADLERVVIGHMDCLDDSSAHVAVIQAGAWLGFDRINSLRYQTDEVRVDRLIDLFDAGLEDRILLSTDTAMLTRLTANGGAGYAAPVTVLVPRLIERNVSEEIIEKLLYVNAWNYLGAIAP